MSSPKYEDPPPPYPGTEGSAAADAQPPPYPGPAPQGPPQAHPSGLNPNPMGPQPPLPPLYPPPPATYPPTTAAVTVISTAPVGNCPQCGVGNMEETPDIAVILCLVIMAFAFTPLTLCCIPCAFSQRCPRCSYSPP